MHRDERREVRPPGYVPRGPARCPHMATLVYLVGPDQMPLAPAVSRSAQQRSLARSTGHPLPASRCRRAPWRKRLTKGRR
jgi:hypothetical protein